MGVWDGLEGNFDMAIDMEAGQKITPGRFQIRPSIRFDFVVSLQRTRIYSGADLRLDEAMGMHERAGIPMWKLRRKKEDFFCPARNFISLFNKPCQYSPRLGLNNLPFAPFFLAKSKAEETLLTT